MTIARNIVTAKLGWVLIGLVVCLTGCSMGYRPGSPEVSYSKQSSKAAALQVPPDLTDVSEGEQYVLPGTTGAAVTRDTLLPQFTSATYQRNEQEGWLMVAATAEKVWPQLLDFMRSERIAISRTEPATGLIVSQWQSTTTDEDIYQRIAFRLERQGTGTRVFARSQQASKANATQPGADAALWPPEAGNPEQSSRVLQRLLLFVGLEEQKAAGLLSEQAALDVLNNATLEVDAGRSRLLLHQNYTSALKALKSSLSALGFEVGGAANNGSIRIIDTAGSIKADSQAYTLRVEPVHLSAVKVSVLDADGNPAQVVDARKLLGILHTRLAHTRLV